jgi:hypothetical protein
MQSDPERVVSVVVAGLIFPNEKSWERMPYDNDDHPVFAVKMNITEVREVKLWKRLASYFL